jgi:DNA repair protein RadC
MNKLTELQISYSHAMSKSQRIKISDSKQCYSNFMKIWNKDLLELQEQFYILFLNRSNEILGFKCTFLGGMSSTIVDIKLIYGMDLNAVLQASLWLITIPLEGLNLVKLTNISLAS